MPEAQPETSLKKRVAVFLDGTWNTVNDNTNVWRLKSLLAGAGTDGLRQIPYYHKGVGTTFGSRLRGGMFGYGLNDEIIRAYEWLIDNYSQGDELFIFGFSRGAYTARSLSGLISQMRPYHDRRTALRRPAVRALPQSQRRGDDSRTRAAAAGRQEGLLPRRKLDAQILASRSTSISWECGIPLARWACPSAIFRSLERATCSS